MSEESHSFLPHLNGIGISGLGAGDADWPTGADLYAPNLSNSSDALMSSTGGLTFGSDMGVASARKVGKKGKAGVGGVVKSESVGLRSPSGASSDKVEVIVCQGTATIIPKSRSTVERRYVCNGHPIHRVTFWRHRKHGCPHVTGEGGEGYVGDGTSEGVPAHSSAPKPKRIPKERELPVPLSSLPSSLMGMSEHDRDFDSVDMSPRGGLFGTKMEVPSFGTQSVPNMSLKMKPMSMGYPLVDAVVDLAPHNTNPYDLRSSFSMNEITPGNVPTQLDASSLGPQIPSFQGSSSSSQYGFLRNPGQSILPNGGQSVMPPFSLLTDALNLYYAPYRPAELDEEEISSPIHTTYVNHSSPYNSDRSEASDFMEDATSDGVFKSYLERHE